MESPEQMTNLSDFLLRCYPGDLDGVVAVRAALERICRVHIEHGLADTNFEAQLCSSDNARFWQHLSEALFSYELLQAGLDLRPTGDSGPDLLVIYEGRKIWIEVICPEPKGLPNDWLEARQGVAIKRPNAEILLRWTAAIKEKAQKLLGNTDDGRMGYLGNGIVAPNDAYVIAVNARLLRGDHFPSITGISQSPFAVEAVLPVGPFAIQIDRRTMETVGSGHQYRPTVQKSSGSRVLTETFLDPRYSRISAILAADIDESAVIGSTKPMAIVHNPNAINPVPIGLLPAFSEYVASLGQDELSVERKPGRLAHPGS
jgi:type I restriction enzyme S subunit